MEPFTREDDSLASFGRKVQILRPRLLGRSADIADRETRRAWLLGLFDDAERDKNRQLDDAADDIRAKFGPTALNRGGWIAAWRPASTGARPRRSEGE